MKNKLLTKVLAILATLAISVSTIGCGPAQTPAGCLDVFVMEAGYGYQWCDDLMQAFAKQDWVKEKYPDLTLNFQHNDNKSYVETKLKAGAKNNTFDLLFGEVVQTYLEKYAGEYLYELTDSVYSKQIPGETQTYEEKCYDSYNQSNQYPGVTTADGDPRYFIASWAGGMNGIFYNEEILIDQLGFNVPRTTDELIWQCEQILALKGNTENKYNKGFSFIQSKGLGYLQYLFPIWWGQYQSVESIYDFYKGVDDGMSGSKNIFKQEGRLHALKAYEDLFFYDYNETTKVSNAFLTPSSNTYDFMTAQSLFLKGEGVFHVNGDWYENEMKDMKADIVNEGGRVYDIKLMRTPIISAIRYKFGITDVELRATVDYVDGVTTTKPTYASYNTDLYESVDEIIDEVRVARGVVNASGPFHTAVIPTYAREKDIAADFLLFMATDVAQSIYIKSTGGSSLPFEYNLKVKDPATYNALSPMHKERHDYFNDANIDIQITPNKSSFPLVQFGGVSEFTYGDYYSVFSSSDNVDKNGNKIRTAESIYNATLDAWNDKKWTDALDKAGLR